MGTHHNTLRYPTIHQRFGGSSATHAPAYKSSRTIRAGVDPTVGPGASPTGSSQHTPPPSWRQPQSRRHSGEGTQGKDAVHLANRHSREKAARGVRGHRRSPNFGLYGILDDIVFWTLRYNSLHKPLNLRQIPQHCPIVRNQAFTRLLNLPCNDEMRGWILSGNMSGPSECSWWTGVGGRGL
jgi:hypothetical protein